MKRIHVIGFTILIAIFTGCENASDLKILKWGPQSTQVGKVFNMQPSGESALWFKISGTADVNSLEAYFGDHRLNQLTISSHLGSLVVPTELLRKPGKYPVYLLDTLSMKRIDIGSFEVGSPTNDAPKIKITKWGPQETKVGKVFNKQPNGQSALWFNISGSGDVNTMEAWFGDHKLDQFVGLVKSSTSMSCSAIVPTNLLKKQGEYPVYLIHPATKKRFDVGTFKITSNPSK